MYSLTTAWCALLWTSTSPSVVPTAFVLASAGLDTHDPQACKDKGGAALLQSIVQAVSEHERADEIRPTLKRAGDTQTAGNAPNAASRHETFLEDPPGSSEKALEDFLIADRLTDGNVENDYDCAMDWENWELVWTHDKKEWCCKHKQLGCPASTRTGRRTDSDDQSDGAEPEARRRRRHGGEQVEVARSFRPPAKKLCVTRDDTRVVSDMSYTAAPPGTRCVFGVDRRDEGWHCIMDGGRFGSNGWCFTSSKRDMWGSCEDDCPLSGQAKVVGTRVENVSDDLHRIPSIAVPAPM